MKKTININLGGQAFIIDEEAYNILHSYLEALGNKFTNEGEKKEILADIEARIAEVFAQRLGKVRSVVNEEDVVYIISLLGKPEDIAGETESTSTTGESNAKSNFAASMPYPGTKEKKLFRDPDNKKVGGVIAGMCHYFGFGDPTWIRIAVLIIILISVIAKLGFGFPIAVIYFILLVVVPEANSSAEKLQMRGQPVTIQNIEKEVKVAMSTAGASINAAVNNETIKRNAAGTAMSFAMFIAKLSIVFILFICVVLMLALAGVVFGFSLLSSASLTDLTQLAVSSRYIISLFDIGLLLTFGIPLVAIMYVSIKFLTNSKVRNPFFKNTLWAGFLLGVILLTVTSWTVFKDFSATTTVTQKLQLIQPRNGTLKVQLADTMGNVVTVNNRDDDNFSSIVQISGMTKTDYGFAFNDVNLEIAVSPDTNFYIEKVAFSRGANFADAVKKIQLIHYKFSQTDTTLNLDDKFELPKDGKWRGQKIKLRVYIPEGKNVTFADNIDQIDATVKGNDYFDDGMLGNKTLHAENGKIKCTNCKDKVITDEDTDEQNTPDGEDSTGNTKPKGAHITIQHGNKHEEMKNVSSVSVNQNGVSLTGRNDKNEKIKLKVDNHGVKLITEDSTGKTTIIKH